MGVSGVFFLLTSGFRSRKCQFLLQKLFASNEQEWQLILRRARQLQRESLFRKSMISQKKTEMCITKEQKLSRRRGPRRNVFRWGKKRRQKEPFLLCKAKKHDIRVVEGGRRLKCGVPHGSHRPAEPTVFKENIGSERGVLFDRRGLNEQRYTKVHIYHANGAI